MNQQPFQTLSFRWVLYKSQLIANWMNGGTPPDTFVFCGYFPETKDEKMPIQLCAFAFSDTNGYLNIDNPDVLSSHGANALVVNGPLQLTNNQVDAELLYGMVGPNPGDDEYLLFIPELDLQKRVFYNIYQFKLTSTGGVKGSNGVSTNPSPPAML